MTFLNGKKLGYASALMAISIWAVFLLGTRFAVSGNFTVEEVMALRLMTAAIVTIPIMLKLGVALRGQGLLGTVMLTLGGSAIFPYIMAEGLYYASVSDAGALAPGTLPFWAALFSFLILGERPNKLKILGLGLILTGAMFVSLWKILNTSDTQEWKGHILFLLAACLWSIYSICYRKSGLSPLHSLGIGLFWGASISLPLLFIFGDLNFADKTATELLSMAFLQGVLIAILALVLYSIAVQEIGAAHTAAFGALTPLLSVAGGVVLLNEDIFLTTIIGIVLVTFGVLMASGIFERDNQANQKKL
ncbi:DMT family transporter [Paracoccaceae bacterium]|nr:DMT family transporter [Paracoccaceae bacterium]